MRAAKRDDIFWNVFPTSRAEGYVMGIQHSLACSGVELPIQAAPVSFFQNPFQYSGIAYPPRFWSWTVSLKVVSSSNSHALCKSGIAISLQG